MEACGRDVGTRPLGEVGEEVIMRKCFGFLASSTLVICLWFCSGCVSLSMTEEAEWGRLLTDDIVDEPIKHKNVWAAGILSFVIPGTGHFYLGEWGSGGGLFLSNLLWPLSPFWATPAGVTDTKTVNKRYTVEYYTYGPGKQVVEEKERQKIFGKAKGFVQLRMQNGQKDFSHKEITEFLFLQDYPTQKIMALDWHELELRTGARFAGADASEPQQTPGSQKDLPGVSAP